jgi:hypothetical protein
MTTFQVTEVQRHLKGVDYPASGDDLARAAQGNGAPDELVEALRGIGRSVDGPNTVMQELSGQLGGPTGGAQDRSPRSDVEGPAFQVDDVQRHLKGVEYPASGADLARAAEGNGAPDELVELLRGIGRAGAPTDVMKELEPHLGGPQG